LLTCVISSALTKFAAPIFSKIWKWFCQK